MRNARCRAGRYCQAATSASRVPARAAVTDAGSSGVSPSHAPGMGCSQGTSGAVMTGARGSSPGAPTPDGSGRRARRSIAVRQALVAIRYSQVRTEERPRNPG